MSKYTLYTNARLLDPASDLDSIGELLTCDDKIVAIGGKVETDHDAEIIDLEQLCQKSEIAAALPRN